MCDITVSNQNNSYNVIDYSDDDIVEFEENGQIQENNYELVEQINKHIESYSQFVNNTYFEQIYSTHKTQEDLELLKDFSKTNFQINNENDLENFMKYTQQVEKIMDNTQGMIGFCKSFSDCFGWHIKQIIMKIKLTLEKN